MNARERYAPGPATGAEVRKDDDRQWTLVLVRTLRHAPRKVWQALTDPEQLREWAPFDADRNLDAAGATVKLTTVGAPTPHVSETTVTRAEPPSLLENTYSGGHGWILVKLEGTVSNRSAVGATVVVACFCVIAWRGLRAAMRALPFLGAERTRLRACRGSRADAGFA